MNDLPTLYRLADGTQANPSDCSANDKGVLTHKNGVPVAMDSDGKPVEIAREAEVNKTAQAADAGKDAEAAAKAINDGEKAAADAGVKPLAPAPVSPAVKPADESRKIETR